MVHNEKSALLPLLDKNRCFIISSQNYSLNVSIMETFNSLPRARRRDPDSVAESVRQGVRSAIAQQWGKKPMCHVHVLAV